MATYIKGLTDQFPEVQQFTPDYSFLSKALGAQQQRYDRGFAMVRNLYNSVLNTSVTNAENQAFRNQMMKKLEGDIKNLSNMDLSLPQNVSYAQGIFDPLTNDRELMHDMSQTKRLQKAFQTADNYRNSVDGEVRAKYSDIALRDLQMSQESLATAKRGDGSILRTQARDFTPFEDIPGFLEERANKAGLKVEYTMKDGYYLVDMKNGQRAIEPFTQWAKTQIGNRFDRQFEVEARVQSEGLIRGIMESQGLDRNAAAQLVARELMPKVYKDMEDEAAEAGGALSNLNTQIQQFERTYTAGMPDVIKDQYEQLKAKRDEMNNVTGGLAKNTAALMKNDTGVFMNNIQNYLRNYRKNATARDWATSKAMTDVSMKMHADDVALTFARMNHDKQMKMLDSQLRREEMREKFAFDIELETLKGNIGTVEDLGPSTAAGQTNTAVDVGTTISRQNLGEIKDLAFGSENGLINYIMKPTEAAPYLGIVEKINVMADGGKVNFTANEQKLLTELNSKLGISGSLPRNADMAKNLIYNMGIGAYQTYSKHVELDVTGKRRSNAAGYASKANDLLSKLGASIRETADVSRDIQGAYRATFMNSDGSIKEKYRGRVSVMGKASDGKPLLSVSGELSADEKKIISGYMPKGYQDQSRVGGRAYSINKLTGGDFVKILSPNNFLTVKINGEDVTTDYRQGDKRTAFDGININDIAELFGNNAVVEMDPSSQTARVRISVSPNSKAFGSLGFKKDGTKDGQMEVTIPYKNLAQVNSRLAPLVESNSYNPRSAILTGGLLNDPYGTAHFPRAWEATGFKGSLIGSRSGDRYGVIVTGSMEMNGQETPFNKFYPIEAGDPQALAEIDDKLRLLYEKYLNTEK